MKLMEYQAMKLFKEYGIATMNSVTIDQADALEGMLEAPGLDFPVVVKAQVPIGGRGKAGGIRMADTMQDAAQHSRELLGSELLGFRVNQVLISQKAVFDAEWYLSIMLDRMSKHPMVIFSSEGGMDIEELARTHPERIIRLVIDPLVGVQPYTAAFLISQSGLPYAYADALRPVLAGLYALFMQQDALLAEINPLVLRGCEDIIALDGKLEIDDSALYRHPEWLAARDLQQEDPLIKEARSYNFLYIPVEESGRVAVLSNGSGMLMSCIDMITKENIKVGAVLDMGGGATADRISQGMRIMLSSPGIQALLINIFGGITRCDEVANGIREAVGKHLAPGQFVIIRMEGTNKEKGIDIVRAIPSGVLLADNLRESVELLVARRGQL